MATPMSMRVAEGGLAGSLACRSPVWHQRLPSGVSFVALPQCSSERFASILFSATPRPCIVVASIHANDPDFYNIPYVDGIPVGKRLKLWNLPPNCKHSELLEWFSGVDVVVESLEFTDDPALKSQGIGGFVELATKQDACIAIVRLDGYKFRGHYIRMDFAEKRPRPRDYGNRRNRHNRNNVNSSSKGVPVASSRPSVTDMIPRYGDVATSKASSIPRYESIIDSTTRASSNQERVFTSADMGPQISSASGKGSEESRNGGTQESPSYSSSPSSSGGGAVQSSQIHGTSNMHISPVYSSIQPSAIPGTPSPSYTNAQFTSGDNCGSGPSQPTVIPGDFDITDTHINYGSSQQQGSISIGNNDSLPVPGDKGMAKEWVNSVENDGLMSGYGGNIPSSAASGKEGPAQFGSTVFSSPIPAMLGNVPPYVSYGKQDNYKDSLKWYGAPEQAVLEPWSNKSSFRSGPMYGSAQPSSFNRMFVSNLAPSVNDTTLHQLFSRFGTVLEAKVLCEPESRRSRGFGFVAMSSVEEVRAASEALNGWRLHDRSLIVDATVSVKC